MADKTLDQVYRQRTEVFMLAMALAKKLGYEVGVRGDDEWPVLVLVLDNGEEVALHAAASDVQPELLAHKTKRKYDGHSDDDKEKRIRAVVAQEFSV